AGAPPRRGEAAVNPAVTYTEPDPLAEEPTQSPAVRNYLFVGLIALVIYTLSMAFRGSELIALLAAAFAVAGLFARWSSGPFVFLLLTGIQLRYTAGEFGSGPFGGSYGSYRTRRGADFDVTVLIAVLAALVYLVVQFRLFSLLVQAVPTDPRAL